MRMRVTLAVLFVAVVAGASVAYSYAAPKRYDATARVVVHPIPAGGDTYTGIDVLFDSPNQARVIETAGHYFDTPDVVNRVAQRLGLSPSTVRDSLDVHPLGGSNVLLIVGKSRHRDRAAQIANAIVQEGIQQETARFQAQVSAVLVKLRASPNLAAQKRINDLESLQSRPDPTLQTLSAATAPSHAAWPKPKLIIPSAAVAAAVLAGAFLFAPLLRRRRPLPSPVDERRARELDDRERAVAEQRQALERREQELAEQQQALGQRERDVASREQAPPSEEALPTPEAGRLEERLAAVTAREVVMARTGGQLAMRERELDARAEALAEREAELAGREEELASRKEELTSREQELAAMPPPEAEAEPGAPGAWRIEELERLVSDRGLEYPDKIEEWRYYVHFLREQAAPDGTLPASFDYLIDETFAEIL